MPYIWIGFRKKAINAQDGLQNQKKLAWYAKNFQNYWFSSHLVKKKFHTTYVQFSSVGIS